MSLANTVESICSGDSYTVNGGGLQLDKEFIADYTHISDICFTDVDRRN